MLNASCIYISVNTFAYTDASYKHSKCSSTLDN
jgi:hypothetical protein